MPGPLKPIFLLADSQLLFDPRGDPPFPERLRQSLSGADPAAAYLGASNGDDPIFYDLFEAAMERIGVRRRHLVSSSFGADDRAFLERADLVLLAGGDVARGWRVFETTGIREILPRRYFEGAVLVGVSAGAVQLGWLGGSSDPPERASLLETWKLVPAIVDAHDEARDWQRLRRLMAASRHPVRGLGIPSGGGLIHHPDGTMEPVRFPVSEWVEDDGRLRQSLLLPEHATARLHPG